MAAGARRRQTSGMDAQERFFNGAVCAIGSAAGVGIAMKAVAGPAGIPWFDQVGGWLTYPAAGVIALFCVVMCAWTLITMACRFARLPARIWRDFRGGA